MKLNYGNNLGPKICYFEINCLEKELYPISDEDILIIHILHF